MSHRVTCFASDVKRRTCANHGYLTYIKENIFFASCAYYFFEFATLVSAAKNDERMEWPRVLVPRAIPFSGRESGDLHSAESFIRRETLSRKSGPVRPAPLTAAVG